MFTTNTEFLKAEMADVLRLFGDVPDVAHTFVYAENNFMNAVIVGGREYDFCERQECAGEIEFKRYARRFAKLALYEALRAETGRSMPWGALTGIRPTKLAYAEQAAGRRFEPLFEKFGVSRENIALVRAVLDAQQGIYAREEGAADLYIGIPFCPSKCDYCSFITADISRTGQYVEGYLSALEKEIAACRGLFRRLKSIYIGGGTPLVLETPQLRRVLDAAAPFAEGQEYTVEAGRPDVFTEEKLRLLKDYGVTRICVNPQTFSDETLARIGRRHSAEDVVRAYEQARAAGFSVINMDTIAGLDGDTPESFADTISRLIALAPENITVHTLAIKRGADLSDRAGNAARHDAVRQMLDFAMDRLPRAGYGPYYLYRQKFSAGGFENVGWCKPGAESFYNIAMMEEIQTILSCGAGGVSKRVERETGRITRYSAPKYPREYLDAGARIAAGKRRLLRESEDKTC